MRNHSFAIALLLVVGGCTGEAEQTAPTESTETGVSPEPVAPADAETDQIADQNPNLIPAAFHGSWDYIGGSCAPESDMRMQISGDEVLFYESFAAVTAVTAEGQDVVLTLAMEGEGEVWVQQTRLSLSGSGEDEQLATSDGDAPKVEDEYPRKRCPE